MFDLSLIHTFSIDKVFQFLETSKNGLTNEQVEERKKIFGKNCLKEEKQQIFLIFFRQFKSVIVYVLFFASFVSFILGEFLDFFVIFFIILANGLIGFTQELKANASIAALKKLTESKNRVIRNGAHLVIPSLEIVPGDYMLFQEGEIVTADVRLTESKGLMIDESSITGESAPVIKNHEEILSHQALPYELSNMLLAGTIVVRGAGRGVAVRTNGKTYLSSIAEKVQEKSPETPLNKALDFFMRRYVFILVLIFILLGFIGFSQGRPLLDLCYILLAGLVSAVPQGLIVVITLVMVIGALALSKKNALIRYLPSVETLGSITVLASDKTGTITEGRLIVKDFYTQDLITLKKIAALCNDAQQTFGDPLDKALASWVDNYEQIRATHARVWEHPFDARLMLMATVNKSESGEELFIKGAFEALQEKSENGHEFHSELERLLSMGLRVIALGHGNWNKNHDPRSWKIKIIGLVGFLDPPKEGVKNAVIAAKKAGIHVLMITGDHPITAKEIAKEVGIWNRGDFVLTGKEIEGLSHQDLLRSLKKTTVLARVLPEHKYLVVKVLQNNQEIVAVTGDGINDVPALKIADIGIAMGAGTEAAKSVSKMILTDNNLTVIVSAIKNARVIAANIRKVVYYLISTTVQEVFLIVFSILTNVPLPLVAIQILWINLITDGVLDKTFPFAKEEEHVMNKKPCRPEKQFFDFFQIVHILSYGFSVGFLCFMLYLHLMNLYPKEIVSTVIFTCVVVAQWANGIQSQKEKEPFFKNIFHSFKINPLIYLGVCIGLILQCIVIYLVPGLFHLIPIEWIFWKYPVGIFLASFGVVEIRKWIEYFTVRNQFWAE